MLRIIPKSICVLGILALTGCASTSNYQNMVNRWHGQNAQKLVDCWGYPSASIKLPNKNTAYLYKTMDSKSVSHTSQSNEEVIYYCRTWFESNQQGIIVGSQFQGDNCVTRDKYGLTP